jgi:hypothetical protein
LYGQHKAQVEEHLQRLLYNMQLSKGYGSDFETFQGKLCGPFECAFADGTSGYLAYRQQLAQIDATAYDKMGAFDNRIP